MTAGLAELKVELVRFAVGMIVGNLLAVLAVILALLGFMTGRRADIGRTVSRFSNL